MTLKTQVTSIVTICGIMFRILTLVLLQICNRMSRKRPGSMVVIGHMYSLLDWTLEPSSSWSLSIDVEHVSNKQTGLEVSVE